MKLRLITAINLWVCASVFCFHAAAQSTISKEEVLRNYLDHVQAAQELQAHIKFQYHRFYKNIVTDDLKPELEDLYSLPVEDALYKEFPLFFNSAMMMDWDIILNGVKMTGAQRLLSSYTILTTNDPRVNASGDQLRKLESSTTVAPEYRFTLQPIGNDVDSNMLHLIIPQAMVDFHYIPNLWYPRPELIGMPSDVNKIEFRTNSIDPHVFLFTPERLDGELMTFLRGLAMNQELQESDLTVMLVIDKSNFSCLKLDIGVKRPANRNNDWEKDNLIMIDNQVDGLMPGGLPYPSVSSIWVNVFVLNEQGEKSRKILYNAELRVQSIEALQ
ncbi:MAG: hypothetical protein GC154_10620 [bacterium]|nr:hypothetical protein [bacterium]